MCGSKRNAVATDSEVAIRDRRTSNRMTTAKLFQFLLHDVTRLFLACFVFLT
jgi:hypothetical protein